MQAYITAAFPERVIWAEEVRGLETDFKVCEPDSKAFGLPVKWDGVLFRRLFRPLNPNAAEGFSRLFVSAPDVSLVLEERVKEALVLANRYQAAMKLMRDSAGGFVIVSPEAYCHSSFRVFAGERGLVFLGNIWPGPPF